jgi:hypothetical protein
MAHNPGLYQETPWNLPKQKTHSLAKKPPKPYQNKNPETPIRTKKNPPTQT